MTSDTSPPVLLTPKDVAQRLGLSLTAVYELLESGELPHIRIGAKRGRYRIEPAELDAYIDRGRVRTPITLPANPRRRTSTRNVTTPAASVLKARGWDGKSLLRS